MVKIKTFNLIPDASSDIKIKIKMLVKLKILIKNIFKKSSINSIIP